VLVVLVTLAGGVGAARMLRGLVEVVDPAEIVAVVNTGDDVVLHGLHISPDLDTVTYTLADAINPETGWGLSGETWAAMDALAAYGSGDLAWFRLGDRDLGTHLYRTSRLAAGVGLSQVTAEICRRWGVGVRLLPMSDDRVETRVTVAGVEIGFQEYFVGRRHEVAVEAIRFAGAEAARPSSGVLNAIATADLIVVCPSNPLVSIAPILAVPGVRDALAARRPDVVAVSPIVAGAALKGPADHMLTELGHDSSVVGVARLYAGFASTLVIDEADAGLAGEVERAGLRCVVAPTVMSGPAEAAALARTVISAGGRKAPV
jgi:LPPG:FO 2-phospho-L-lactate transferase